jgi:hypothetical protein
MPRSRNAAASSRDIVGAPSWRDTDAVYPWGKRPTNCLCPSVADRAPFHRQCGVHYAHETAVAAFQAAPTHDLSMDTI